MSEFLDDLAKLGQLQEAAQASYEAEVDSWWNELPIEYRERAFYAVVKRIFQGELIDKGSYRYILYDIFGFDGGMYIRGMDCGFMALHNSIVDQNA